MPCNGSDSPESPTGERDLAVMRAGSGRRRGGDDTELGDGHRTAGKVGCPGIQCIPSHVPRDNLYLSAVRAVKVRQNTVDCRPYTDYGSHNSKCPPVRQMAPV
jgi:hypothetical protein